MRSSAPSRLIAKLAAIWGPLWPLVTLPLWILGALTVLGEARVEHFVILILMTALATYSATSADILRASAPGFAILLGYEIISHMRGLFVVEGRIVGCGLRDLDAALFGFDSGQTPADLFRTLHSPSADVFFALPYTLFWLAVVIYVLVLYRTDRRQMDRYLWLLALVHLAAFVLWLAMPSAPPWYIREQGCMIDPDALPSAAALARLDDRFGITYFAEFYARAPTVFGAFPSLHVAFPAAAMVAAWSRCGPPGRSIHLCLTAWMLLASVYLDHHWLLDGLASVLIILLWHQLLIRVWPRYSYGDESAT